MPEDAIARLSAALQGSYTLERKLGEGGMASVYLAGDLKHQRQVAIKVLKPEVAAVLGAERFLQEITTTAQLQHPHILPLFDSGEADGAASVSTASGFTVTGRTDLFADTYVFAVAPHANYDVSPDGIRLLMVRGAQAPEYDIVYGWGSELAARMRGSGGR